MPDERTVDPRFDPRYQRGFDPSTMPVEPETLRAPVEDAGPVPPASTVPAAKAHEPHGFDEPDDDDELEPLPTRNPFRLALLLTSIGLLAIATAIMWWTATNRSAFLWGSARETPLTWMFQQMTQIVPAAAAVAGFVGLGAWLALGALASLGRRSVASRDGDDGD